MGYYYCWIYDGWLIMGIRKKIYYPKGQIQNGLHTDGKEWMLEDGTEYRGQYHRYITGEVFTLGVFIKNVSKKLIPYLNLNNKDVKTSFEYDSLIKSKQPTFEFAIHSIIVPSQDDYDFGYFTRYFAKRHFNNVISELNSNDFEVLQPEHYITLELGWKIVGNLSDVVDVNRKQTFLGNETIEGLSNYITNYSEFLKV